MSTTVTWKLTGAAWLLAASLAVQVTLVAPHPNVPAHLDPPPNLIAACLFDGFFQAPVLLFVIFGLVRLRPWLRPLALFYAGAATTNMFFYFTQTFLGPHSPTNVAYYLAFNLPWLIAPMALCARVWLGSGFEAASGRV